MALANHPQHFSSHQYHTFPPCDSYFVENPDETDGIFARAAAEREHQRQVAKLRQKALAERLSNITAEEYESDVLSHMERMAVETMPDLQAIEIQSEIQWFMRPYLLDFLLEAHHAFQLLPETLHLTVNLLDRYCSRRVVYKRHYQLVGCAALLIAAKYGDRKERVPTIRELKSMCCSLYDDDMFTQMEWHVLQTLNWVIGHPTVTGFLQLALRDAAADPELEHMSWFLMEMSLYHKEFIPVQPSVMARSALALARCILDRPQAHYQEWSSGYDSQVVLGLFNYLGQPLQALSHKYASPHLSSVSTTVEVFLARQAAMNARAIQTSTQELPAINTNYSSATQNQLLTPTTPQKPGYAAMSYGVLTPPITPDKDFAQQQALAVVPSMNVATPPPSAEPHRLHFQDVHHFPSPNQYMA